MRHGSAGRSGLVITAGSMANGIRACGVLSGGHAKDDEQVLRVLMAEGHEHCEHPGAHSAHEGVLRAPRAPVDSYYIVTQSEEGPGVPQ